MLGLAFLQQNRTVSEVAALLDVSNDAVHAWLYKFKSGGLEAIRDQGGRGRKTLIPEDRYEEFKDAVLLATPALCTRVEQCGETLGVDARTRTILPSICVL